MAVKIKDVALAANVSIATVSYVLNNSAPVSVETRRRVLDAATRLGYRANSTARNLKASQTRLIGYAWHNVEHGQMNPILDRFIYCMALAAEANGYHVLTFTQSPAEPAYTYDELIRTSRVDGFILASTDLDDVRIQHLMELGFPFVAFGRANSDWDFPYVDVDVKHGIHLAVEHLLELGHRRIGCVGWPNGSLSGDARLAGYLETMRANGIDPQPGWIVRSHNLVDASAEAAHTLMMQPTQERLTAIVAVSDVMAIGAMSYLESAGLTVGKDVAITGFDDHPMAVFMRPSLTSLHQPIDEIAVKVIEMLMAILNNQVLAERSILVQPVLRIRGSSSRNFTEDDYYD